MFTDKEIYYLFKALDQYKETLGSMFNSDIEDMHKRIDYKLRENLHFNN